MRAQRAGAWQDWGSVVNRVGTEGEDEEGSLDKGDPGRRNHCAKALGKDLPGKLEGESESW